MERASPQSPYRVAIVGVGAIADLIAVALGELARVKLVAGSCRTEAKGKAFAGRFDCAWYDDTTRMLDDLGPDVAIVCTPSGLHLDAVLACAKRQIHVVCEKPLEITPDRCRRMIEACESAGVRLGAIFPSRFNPVNRTIHAAAAAGRFGDLAVVHAAVPWWRDDAYYAPTRWQGKVALDGGGALMNQAIHTLDQILWLAAATMKDLPRTTNPIEEVFAYTAKRSHDPKLIEVEDTSIVSLKFRNGALGQLLAATSMWPGSQRRLYISGRDGTAEVLEDQLVTFSFRNDEAGDEAKRQAFAQVTKHGGGASNPMAMSHENHRENLRDFFDALHENRPPELDGREAAKAVAVIAAAYHSARTGTPIRVE